MIVLGTVCVLRAPPTPEVQLLTDTVNEPHNQEQLGEERGHSLQMHVIVAKAMQQNDQTNTMIKGLSK